MAIIEQEGRYQYEKPVRVKPREMVQAQQDEDSLRSIEISQMRILARKRPKEYLKIASEIHLDIDAALTA